MGMRAQAFHGRLHNSAFNTSSSSRLDSSPTQQAPVPASVPPYNRQSRAGGRNSTSVAREEHRYWSYSDVNVPNSAGRFTVVSYNILGVDNANQQLHELYSHIPAFIMDWEWRKGKILFELGLWSPDVLCLQEVDRFDDLEKAFVSQGYEGRYKGRTGGSTDGCALFWRTRKFDLIQEENIEFQELDMRHNVAQLCVLQVKYKEQGRGQKLFDKVEKRILVCNIHVLFNPNRGDIKLGQVRHLLKRAYTLSQKWGGIPVIVAGDFNSIPQSPLYQYLQNSNLDVSSFDRRKISGQVEVHRPLRMSMIESRWTAKSHTIFREEEVHTTTAGGNSLACRHETVRCESTLEESQQEWQDEGAIGTSTIETRTFETGTVDTRTMEITTQSECSFGKPWRWTEEEIKLATGDPMETLVSHDLKLHSAYASVQGPAETRDSIGEPLLTTYHGKFMGTVDYIWFTEGLVPVKVLDILPVRVLHRTRGLPSKKWGSDHMSLVCEFFFPND